MTEIGPWMPAIVPGPPRRADVDGGQGVAGDVDRLVVGDDIDRAAVIGAGDDVEHAEKASVVDVDRVDAALAVDVGDDEVGRAVDCDVIVAIGAEVFSAFKVNVPMLSS